MVRRYVRIPAALATAFTGAVLAINIAQPAENQPTLEVPTDPLLLVQEKDKKGLPPEKKAPEPKIPEAKSVQPEPAVPSTATSAAPSSSAAAAASAAPSGGFFGSAGGGSGTAAANPASTASTAGVSATQQAAPTTSSSVVGGGEAASRASSDLGDLLGKSIGALGVAVHHRSQIISEPFIRGYHIGQYITQVDGGYWFPARQDLDTIVSKIDSSQIENVVIIKGPYSVRYGPGFSFLDVETLSTPRYEDGAEFHGMTGMTYKTNNQQWAGIQSVWGGSENYGYRLTVTGATGGDYYDGSGVEQPSSFHSYTYNLAVGWNIGQYARVELKGMHVEQPNVEIPGSFFDLSFLGSDAYTGRFIFDDHENGKLQLDTWFNYTQLTGNNFGGGKRAQLAFFNSPFQAASLGAIVGGRYDVTTEAEMASWGYKGAFTLGGPDQPQITIGTDLRYLDTQANEFDHAISPTPLVPDFASSFPIPHSYAQNPGVFLDGVLPLLDNRLKINGGVRFDWVRTAISELQPPAFPGTTNGLSPLSSVYFAGFTPTGQDLSRAYTLWSCFVAPEYKLTDELTLLAGAGYGQRPPTMTELYSLQPFLGVLQNGVNFVTGNPFLAPETLRQVDLGAKYNGQSVRAGVNVFYAWIHNYITYQNESTLFLPTTAGAGFQYVNTNEAILAGGETYAEWDATRWLTLFGTLAYVEGRDLKLGSGDILNPGAGIGAAAPLPGPKGTEEPLPNIPPMDGRVGFRLRDPRDNPKWGLEFAAHMVATQDRVATSLTEQRTGGYTLFDIRTYWRPNEHWLITSGIENLGNRLYREWSDLRNFGPVGAYSVLQPGINYYIGARLTY